MGVLSFSDLLYCVSVTIEPSIILIKFISLIIIIDVSIILQFYFTHNILYMKS
jgi:hypothetical protein